MILKGVNETIAMLNNLQTGVNAVALEVITKFATKVMQEAVANMPKSATSDYGITVDVSGNKVTMYFNGDMAGWLEFGTGAYAANLLQSRPLEWKKEAMKFFVNGSGRTPAKSYLYPAYERNLPQLYIDLDREVQAWLTQVR